MTDLYNDPAHLASVLTLLNANDTKTIKRGEKILKPFTKNKNCILPLFNQLQTAQNVSVRHHAALLLKKKLGSFFKEFTHAQQVQLRSQLLSIMVNEQVSVVGTSLAGCVAIVAKEILGAKQQWPELFQALGTLSVHPTESLKVLNYRLLEQLSEHVALELKPHTATLAQMFQAGCQDSLPAVSTAAFKAASSFINEIGNEPEVLLLTNCIVPMLTVMNTCLSRGEEDTVVDALDFIQNCCALEQPLIDVHIAAIVQLCMQVVPNENYENAVRNAAFQTMLSAVEFRPKLLSKQNLVSPILAALMEMISKAEVSAAGSLFSFAEEVQAADEGEEDDEDDEKIDVNRFAQTMIDQMAISIPSKYFANPALTLCAQGMSSPTAHMRKAGCAVLGVMVEGCADFIRENLAMILPALLSAVADPEFYVREVACFALGQFSEFCQPEITNFHAMVLPVLLKALDDPKPTVQATCCYVLEYFCENLQPSTLRPVLPIMLQKLAAILQTGDRHCKQTALSAISAAAVASEKDFLPFVEGAVSMLGGLLFTTEPATYNTRGRALECLGHIAVGVGSEPFRKYFPIGMQSAQQGITLKDESLSEYSYVFFANAAKVMKLEMLPFMPALVPHLHEIISESEMTKALKDAEDEDEDEDEDYVPAAASGAAEDGEEESEEDVSDYNYNVHEGFINTKKAALTALGALAEHTEAAFYPYLLDSMRVVMDPDEGVIGSVHDDIRSEAYSIMQYFVVCACRANGIAEDPAKQVAITLPMPVIKVAHDVLEALISSIDSDTDKETVGRCLESLQAVVIALGMSVMTIPVREKNEPAAQHIMCSVLKILQEQQPCQARVESREEDDEDDHDNLVMDTVTDLIGTFAKTMGESFMVYFDEFHKHLMKFTKPNRLHSDRSMAIGCYGEVVAEMGPGVAKYAPFLLPMIKMCLIDSMEGVRRNAAYCVGALIQSTGDALAPKIMEILSWLYPLCQRPEHKKGSDVGGADIDNALAAVCRMISAAPAAVPLQHVLPVLLSALPLVSDNSEGPGVYTCLCRLIIAKEANAVAHFPAILNIFAECFNTESTAIEETKKIVAPCLQQLFVDAQFRPVITTFVPTIADPQAKASIEAILAAAAP